MHSRSPAGTARLLSLVLVTALAANAAPAAAAIAGTLDPSFGANGVTTPPAVMRSYSVALQPDGKIVVAGSVGPDGQWDFAVARYTSAGQPDPTFSGDGFVRTNISGSEEARAVLVQPDGKIVVVGHGQQDVGTSVAKRGMRFVRYRPDGRLDTTFSGDGKQLHAGTFANPVLNTANAATLQPDGKIVAVGGMPSGGATGFTAVRLTTRGARDIKFSGDGMATYTTSAARSAQSVGLQSDGRIVVGGAAGDSDQGMLVRFTAAGSLDASFGSSGAVLADWNSASRGFAGLAVMSDDRIVVPGRRLVDNGSSDELVAARYTRDGLPDTSFSQDGIAAANKGSTAPTSVVLQTDGKVVTVGERFGIVAVARFLPDGGVDAGFGTNGARVVDVPTGEPRAVLQADGRMVVLAGGGAARLIMEGTPDPPPSTETCSGKPVTIEGTAGADALMGTSGPDVIWGGAGNDVVNGGGGDDVICGGDDNDRIVGGPGADVLDGDAGTDIVDYIFAPTAVSVDLTAGTASGDGADTLSGMETVYGSTHADTLLGSEDADKLAGLDGDDQLDGRGGNDTLYGQLGADQVDGGSGTDTASYANAEAAVTVDLAAGTASGDGSDVVSEVENIAGSPFDDVLTGSDGANTLYGSGGDDQLAGAGGNDILFGVDGADALAGGADTDYCDGGDGTADTADGECETKTGIP